MLSKNLEQCLHQALDIAHSYHHEYATLEHLLLALLHDQETLSVLKACAIDIDLLKKDLDNHLKEDMQSLVNENMEDSHPTEAFQRVLQRAVIHVQSAGREEVTGGNVLVALFSERDSYAVYFLQKQELSRLDVVNYLSHGVVKSMLHKESSEVPADEEEAPEKEEGDKQPDALDAYCIHLNEKAKAGDIDPLIGRQKEIERTIQILCRRQKNNPLYVGEPGVGKTAIVEGLAKFIVEDEVPDVLKDTSIYSLDMGSLLAGTRYRGDFEERFKAVLAQIKALPKAILFIDEIHTVIGAGATSGGAMDASNLLKPVLSNSRFRCIGSTTYKEYRNHFEKDRALVRRFQKIDVAEPSIDETVKILHGLKPYFEKHHNVKYSKEAITEAVRLSVRYIHQQKLPDKAVDVIDEVGAAQKLLAPSKRKKMIKPDDIESVVAKMARVPARRISSNDRKALQNIKRDLETVVFGQQEAINALNSSIKLARAGLREPEKPTGSYLFTGPTGVGKTEVARQLSRILGVELIRFDMSEYMERHSVSRLIGAPPGYVGFEDGGLLTEAVEKNPYSIVLLDEIEKAHPDLFNILLQVMDHGKLTDSNGRVVDFRHVMLIMTTNAGAAQLESTAIGFERIREADDNADEIKKLFKPEFRNRLDAIIPFHHLTLDIVEKIVEKFMMQLEAQLSDRAVTITLSAKAKKWLAKKGYDQIFGARPLSRVIQEKVKEPMAEEILFGALEKGGFVNIDLKKDQLTFDYQNDDDKSKKKAKKTPAKKSKKV